MAKKTTFWKLLIGLTAVLSAIYAFSSTYLWARQAHFIFSPERNISKTPAEYELPFEDVYVSVNSGDGKKERIHAWWIPAQYSGNHHRHASGHQPRGGLVLLLAGLRRRRSARSIRADRTLRAGYN